MSLGVLCANNWHKGDSGVQFLEALNGKGSMCEGACLCQGAAWCNFEARENVVEWNGGGSFIVLTRYVWVESFAVSFIQMRIPLRRSRPRWPLHRYHAVVGSVLYQMLHHMQGTSGAPEKRHWKERGIVSV